ncbi:MAG: TolC family protein, partial [Gammaproteobacteria bacterium]|nr:TolC family protein [Gammaproteobacteria bacterium]
NQLQIEAMREKAQASFNLLLNRDGNSKVTLDSKEPDSLPELDKLTVLIAKAKESRPEFRKASLNISAAKDRMGLADKEYYPDFQLGAIYGWRQDDTGLASMQLSMNLPFNTENRQDKKRDQRRYEWLQKKYDLQDLENTVEEEIYQALTDYKRSRKQTLIYQDRIIPQATQTVDSMLAGYQVNKVDFLNLLRSQVNLLNFQTQYWLAFSTANQALAALEYAVGGVDVYEK